MKRTFLSVVAVLFAAISANAALTSSDGCYQISSADDLYEFAELFEVFNKDSLATRLDCAKLTQDIVVNKNVLKVDGTPNEGSFRPWDFTVDFVGTFDGQNHTISGLYQVKNDNLGMFRKMTGTIKNLGIVDSYFYVPIEDYNFINSLGALVSYVIDSLVIENCFSSATVGTAPEGRGIAGLVGDVSQEAKLTIKDSRNEGLIISSGESSGTGGLVGYANDLSKVTLINSYNTGTIRGENGVGGLIGNADVSATRSAKLYIERCYNSGHIYGSYDNVGGLVGRGLGIIKESYNIGAVDGACFVGGLIGGADNPSQWGGRIDDTLRIENSFNRGTVEAIYPEWVPDSLADLFRKYYGHVVGGFIGEVKDLPTVIVNSYNAADVVYDSNVVNSLVGKIEDCEVKIENTVNRKVAGGTSSKDVFTVEDSLFNNGVVATYLHEYDEVWGQESIGKGTYPDFSGTVKVSIGVHSITWHTFDGDTTVYPSKYTEGLGLLLPADIEREGYLFDGWYAVAKPTAADSKIDRIKTDETGAKTLYAQWVKLKMPESDGACYLISSVQDLYSFVSIVNGINGMEINESACGKLTQDIVVNELVLTSNGELNVEKSFRKWIPMKNFAGVFDGNGHAIYGLYYDDMEDEDGVGFISEIYLGGRDVKKAEIKNLGLEDFYFRGGYRVGAFVGYAHASTEGSSFAITNSHSNGVVEGKGNVGGFVGGVNVKTEITGSYNKGFVYADEKMGGFIGYIDETSVDIIDSYNSGFVSGSSGVGGLVGYIYHYQTLTILRSYNVGEVRGASDVGGLVGTGYGYPDIVFINSYNKGRVTGSTSVAGLLGWMKSVAGSVSVFNSFNAGEIVSGAGIGGRIGTSLVGYGEGGYYSFDNVYYLDQPNMTAINLYKPEDENSLFNPVVDMDDFTAVTEEQLMGGSVAESLRGWYEKDDYGKPRENGQDGFAWAEDPAGTKILPHLNWDNVKHRVVLVAGEGV